MSVCNKFGQLLSRVVNICQHYLLAVQPGSKLFAVACLSARLTAKQPCTGLKYVIANTIACIIYSYAQLLAVFTIMQLGLNLKALNAFG